MVFAVLAMAVATAAMAKVVNSNSKIREVKRRVLECPGDPAHASPAKS